MAALNAAQSWVALVDSGRYAESWNNSTQYAKDKLPKEKWTQICESARKPLGRNTSRKLKSKKYLTFLPGYHELTPRPGAPKGEYVMIEFKSSFENRDSVIEVITPMLEKDGQWRVSDYMMKEK